MTSLKKIVSATLLAYAATPALAQIGPCVATDPPFLAEGPISAVTANGLAGTITSMGMTITVPETAPVSTPTAALDMARFADSTPFPGRAEPGFVGGTVIATGCVKTDANGAHVYLADSVSSDVNENVMLGIVTGLPTVDAEQKVRLEVLGTPVELLQDARMPAHHLSNLYGMEIIPESVVPGNEISIEGYYGDTDPKTLHAWAAEVGGGNLVLVSDAPQVSIQRFRCAGDLSLLGGIYFGAAAGPSCNFDRSRHSLRLFNVEANQQIPFNSADTKLLDVIPGVTPDEEFCSYRLDIQPAACPANIRIELLQDGQIIATASTSADQPAANTAPVATADEYSILANTPLVIGVPGVLANDSDADAGDTLTAAVVLDAANGDLVFGTDGNGDGSFTYTPALDFSGTDSFTYVAVDSKGALSEPVTVTIQVGAPPQRAPVASNDAASLPHATASVPRQATIDVLANDSDADGDALSINSITQPLNGSAAIVANRVVFTANAGFVGNNSFSYTARDPGGLVSNAATVTVTTTNTAPTAVADSGSTSSDAALTINVLTNDSDPEGDAMTAGSLTQPATGGTVAASATQTAVVFTPTAGFSGTTSFTYRARDNFGALSVPATVTVTVTEAPPPPPPVVVVDLDIQSLGIPTSTRVNRSLGVSLKVRNSGTVNQPRNATIVGIMNGVEIYNVTQAVSDPVGGGASTANFPAYTPQAAGTISWTATIADDNADIDSATGSTLVR